MTALSINSELLTQLTTIAQQQKRSVETLIEQILYQFLQDETQNISQPSQNDLTNRRLSSPVL